MHIVYTRLRRLYIIYPKNAIVSLLLYRKKLRLVVHFLWVVAVGSQCEYRKVGHLGRAAGSYSDFYPTASSVLSVPEQSGPENPEPSTQYPVPTIQCAGNRFFCQMTLKNGQFSPALRRTPLGLQLGKFLLRACYWGFTITFGCYPLTALSSVNAMCV